MTNADIGNNIREIRLSKKMSSDDLCTAINASWQWLYNRENGIEIIELDNIIKIADALGVPGIFFFCPPHTHMT